MGEVAHTEAVGLDAVVDAADPRRALGHLSSQPAGREHNGRSAVGYGGAVVAAQGGHQVGLLQELLGGEVLRHLGHGVGQGRLAAAGRHLGHLPLVVPRLEPGPGLEGGDADGVGPQRGHAVGVQLQCQHLGQVAQRRLAEGVHQGRVDVAVLQADPGLVQGPGPVHLHVALPDGRPRPHRVQALDEGKGHAGQVVAAAGDGEADLLAGDARPPDGGRHHGHQDLHLVGALLGPHGAGLGEGDDGHVPHQTWSL